MTRRTRRSDRAWLLLPGLTVVIFTLVSIVCPIGSDQIGPLPRHWPGLMPAAARFAQDLHDGFWHSAVPVSGCDTARPFVGGDRGFAGGLSGTMDIDRDRACAQRALVALREGRLTPDDLFETLDRCLVRLCQGGSYDAAEAFAREVDRTLGSGTFRNNLAWYYTQDNRRVEQALALAQASVATQREPYNVDTLAWAYYRCGDLVQAVATAREVLDWPEGRGEVWGERVGPVDPEAAQSSQTLLETIGQEWLESHGVPMPVTSASPTPGAGE